MKKKYIKPIIINIKIYNDDALLQKASLFDINESDSVENIAGEGGEDGPIHDNNDIFWND